MKKSSSANLGFEEKMTRLTKELLEQFRQSKELEQILNILEIMKKIYFLVFLLLLILGFYIIIKPEPFLKYGYGGIFIFNILGGFGTYLIPTLSQKMNLFLLALSTALGMTLNDSISWVIGNGGVAIIEKGKWAKKVEKLLTKYGSVALFIISVLPIPYDAIGLISGYLGIQYKNFFLPTFFGKFLRMILIGLGTRQLMEII